MLLYGFRMLFGSAMVLSLVLGLVAILRRNVARHRAWIMRGYAIGPGRGHTSADRSALGADLRHRA
ncbi:MAG: DUF2306 domain-containing protein [Ktedonobacteraceae bacterium]|nr:DUF2306 domain-containing protein [Ktedonobacteraceae bacterium]MBO0790184.1 DUF2306 domain-containing protein [Ktedonobacteraceae bacterium]